MDAALEISERFELDETSVVEMVVWRLPRPVAGSTHHFKYRLAYIEDDICVIRFDNEAGKGDHKHIGRREQAYGFTDPATLQVDFWAAIDEWRGRR